MPVAATYNGKMNEEHINLQENSVTRACDNDFHIMKDILSKVGTPEYNGYNTCICRETGIKPPKRSVYCYLPLLNITPTDSTLLILLIICISRGFEVTQDASQDILVITADVVIYKVIVDFSFLQPDLLGSMVACLAVH